jgi:hypothetical protein
MDQNITSVPPQCPACEKPMRAKGAGRIRLAEGFVDVIYGCETCAIEIIRTVGDETRRRVKSG